MQPVPPSAGYADRRRAPSARRRSGRRDAPSRRGDRGPPASSRRQGSGFRSSHSVINRHARQLVRLQRVGGDLKQGIARCNTHHARPAIGTLPHDEGGAVREKVCPKLILRGNLFPAKGGQRNESRAHRPQARNRSITAAGIGKGRNLTGLSGSCAAQTRVSLPSTASSPPMEIVCRTSKLERRNSLTSEATSAASLNLAGLRKRARA